MNYTKLYDFLCSYVETATDIKLALEDIGHASTVIQHEYGELIEQRISEAATERNCEYSLS
jgi:hypothetical protein